MCVGISFVFCHRKLHFALRTPERKNFVSLFARVLMGVCVCVWAERRIVAQNEVHVLRLRIATTTKTMLSSYLIECTCTNVVV